MKRISEKEKQAARNAARRWRQRHPDKYRETQKAWRLKNIEHARETDRQRYRINKEKYPDKYKQRIRQVSLSKHGLNENSWNRLFEKQQRKCAVCYSNNPDKRGWVVDHDHKNGKIRGILCQFDNLVIGKLGDNLPEIVNYVSKVLNYLNEIENRKFKIVED